MPDDVTFRCEFEKAAPDGSYIRGWASVATVDGKPVEDFEGDQSTIDDLRDAAHNFMQDARVAKAMHEGAQIGDVVESVIIDDAFAKAHGIQHGKRGWWIGMAINDLEVRKRIVRGDFPAFSMGGTGHRIPLRSL